MSGEQFEMLGPMSGGWSHGVRQMEGSEEALDVWRSLAVTPKGLFPGFMSDSCNKDDPDSTLNCEKKSENGLSSSFKYGGSIAERRAAKFGFDASKINTSMFSSSSALTSPGLLSPYVLRTPGISPGALLESPMMLPNLQPSPTTGAFGFPRLPCESGVIRSESCNAADKNSHDTFSFTFNPNGMPVRYPFYSGMLNQYPPSSLAHNSGIELDSQHPATTLPPETGFFEFPTQLPSEATVDTSELNSAPDSKSDMAVKVNSDEFQLGNSIVAAGSESQQNECSQGEDTGNSETAQPMNGDQRIINSSGGTVGNSEDGYNWRKYGQKQVKASEYPRSYYKCTHPNCPVKKKVEHCNDGQIIEIVYKGAHIHSKPQPNRRSTFGSLESCESVKVENGFGRRESQHGYDDLKLGSDRTGSPSITTDVLESAGTPELSSTIASNEEIEEENVATEGSTLIVENGDDEPELKRRKMESSLIETALASRAIREPRVIVQIESEVDILDDGYRWRKYGQKVVKGNPNPRSYYKCTHPGCSVRKHVERASHNLKFVLTTYEGKHNHEVPSARNNSHGNSAPSAPNPHQALTFSQNTRLPKPEPQDFGAYSNGRVEYNKDFLKANYLGDFGGGHPFPYQMKFPTLPNNMVYGSFGVNPNYESTTAPTLANVHMGICNDSRPLGMNPPKEASRQD